jgi:pimeloyl-ACP methyl ester carboxylesterase
MPQAADQIFAALQHLDDKPLALFGHSMGTVLRYADRMWFGPLNGGDTWARCSY